MSSAGNMNRWAFANRSRRIFAVGRIVDRVVQVGVGADAGPGIRPMIILTLSSDHRIVDGGRAAEFLRDLVAAIGNPQPYFTNPGET